MGQEVGGLLDRGGRGNRARCWFRPARRRAATRATTASVSVRSWTRVCPEAGSLVEVERPYSPPAGSAPRRPGRRPGPWAVSPPRPRRRRPRSGPPGSSTPARGRSGPVGCGRRDRCRRRRSRGPSHRSSPKAPTLTAALGARFPVSRVWPTVPRPARPRGPPDPRQHRAPASDLGLGEAASSASRWPRMSGTWRSVAATPSIVRYSATICGSAAHGHRSGGRTPSTRSMAISMASPPMPEVSTRVPSTSHRTSRRAGALSGWRRSRRSCRGRTPARPPDGAGPADQLELPAFPPGEHLAGLGGAANPARPGDVTVG